MIVARIKEYLLDSKEKDFDRMVEVIHEKNKNANFSEEWRGQYYLMRFVEGIDTESEEIS